MSQLRRPVRPSARSLALAISLQALCAQAAEGVDEQQTLAGLMPSATPASGAKPALPDFDTAGQRLGWMTPQEISQLPANQQPVWIDATCPGAWVTPIPANVVAAPLSQSDINALADNVNYSNDGATELQGQVRLSQPGRLLEADRGSITRNREYARLEGNIRLAEPGVLMTGEQAVVNINTTAGQLLSSEFVSNPINAHGRAERIRRYDDGVMRIDQGVFTSCAPGHRVWALDASHIDLDNNRGIGEVYDAKLRINDVPLIYFPYYRFPLTKDRLTGFLIPRISQSRLNGLDLTTPLYLNLAPNFDATLTPRFMSQRGTMLGGEFRYLTPSLGAGTVTAAMLPNDQITGTDRKSASYKHAVDFGNGWSARADLNYVSDSLYFTDLGRSLNVIRNLYQERVGEARYDDGRLHLLTRAQSFQTLDTTLTDAGRPYARLPQVMVTVDPQRLPGWQFGMRGEVANFRKDINDGSAPEINGVRSRLDPEVRYDYTQAWGYVRPAARFTQLNYVLDGNGASTVKTGTLSIPTLRLDTGMYFDRFGQDGSSQTLEPRLYYLYAPYRNQSTLPNFDTAYNTFSYSQLFRDTRFSGGDRIDDANQLSAGMTTRWINKEGFERAQASVGQIFYYRDRLVQLPTTLAPTTVATSATSNYAGNASFRPTEDWSINSDVLVNPGNNRFSQGAVSASYLPIGERSVYNLGYRYRREDPSISQTAVELGQLSFVHTFNERWKTIGMLNYDIGQRAYQDLVLGVSYESCCWAMRLFKRSYLIDPALVTATSGTSRDEVFLEFTLKGLAGMSSSLDTLLSRNVFGYTQVNNTNPNPYQK